MPKNDFKFCTQGNCARIYGVNIRTVRAWIAAGAPQNPDTSVNTARLYEWLLQREMSKYKTDDSLSAQKTRAEIDRINSQTAKYKNETIERSYMEQVLVSRAASLRQFLERSIMMNLSKFVGLTLDEARTRLNWFAIKAMEAWTGGEANEGMVDNDNIADSQIRNAQTGTSTPAVAKGGGGVSDTDDSGSI